jgi:hypothetical protein
MAVRSDFFKLCREAEVDIVNMLDCPLSDICNDLGIQIDLRQLASYKARFLSTQNPYWAIKACRLARKTKKESNGLLYLTIPEWVQVWLESGFDALIVPEEQPWKAYSPMVAEKSPQAHSIRREESSLEKALGLVGDASGATNPLRQIEIEERNADILFEVAFLKLCYDIPITEGINLVALRYWNEFKVPESQIRQLYAKSPMVKRFVSKPESFIEMWFSADSSPEAKLRKLAELYDTKSLDRKIKYKILKKLFPKKTTKELDQAEKKYFSE